MPSLRALVSIALLVASNATVAAGIDCKATADGYRCDAWPRGKEYTYFWNTVGNMRVAASGESDSPSRRIDCVAGRYGAVAVTVVTPAGYVETATQTLRGCPSATTAAATAIAGADLIAGDGI